MAREAPSSFWDRLVEATRSSIGWAGAQPQAPAGDPEPVRGAMRSLLRRDAGNGTAFLRVACAIERSKDLRSLWYLRASLMQAIARERGEHAARQAVATLDPLFQAAWPEAPVSRRSVLG